MLTGSPSPSPFPPIVVSFLSGPSAGSRIRGSRFRLLFSRPRLHSRPAFPPSSSSSLGFRQQTFLPPTTRRSFLALASIFQSRPRLRLALARPIYLSALPPSLPSVHLAAASSPRLPRTPIPAADLVAALSHDYEGPVRRGFASDACICVPTETIAWQHERALGVGITDRLETDFPHFGRDETARANVGRAEAAVPAPRARVPRGCTRLHVRDAGQSRPLPLFRASSSDPITRGGKNKGTRRADPGRLFTRLCRPKPWRTPS